MNKKDIGKLGKLIAECQRGGILIQHQVDLLFEAMPNLTERQLDMITHTLQAAVVEAKELEEAGMRYESVEMPKNEAELEERQEKRAEEFMKVKLAEWQKEVDEKLNEIKKEAA